MGKAKNKSGQKQRKNPKRKGKYSRQFESTAKNKNKLKYKIQKKLKKRLSWRMRKYMSTPINELSSTTLKLFQNWGVNKLHKTKENWQEIKNERASRKRKKKYAH